MAVLTRFEFGPYTGYRLNDPRVPDEEIDDAYTRACDKLTMLHDADAICVWKPFKQQVQSGQRDDYPTWGWVRTYEPGYYRSVHRKIEAEVNALGEERTARLRRRADEEAKAYASAHAGEEQLFSDLEWDQIERQQIDLLAREILDEGYKRRALRDHPDMPGGSDEKMQRLNFALAMAHRLFGYLRSDEGSRIPAGDQTGPRAIDCKKNGGK